MMRVNYIQSPLNLRMALKAFVLEVHSVACKDYKHELYGILYSQCRRLSNIYVVDCVKIVIVVTVIARNALTLKLTVTQHLC